MADRCFRFAPVKLALLREFGLASHWSCSHKMYATCVAYCYTPSPKKPVAELDPKPFLWPACKCQPPGDRPCRCQPHPPLAQACQVPVTSKAVAERREAARRARAEKGKADKRFSDLDLWPVVVGENVQADEKAAEVLTAYAKRCGGKAMFEYCFKNWDRLPGLVARCWAVETVEDCVDRHARSRLELLEDAFNSQCACGGRWHSSAVQLMQHNGISIDEWRAAMLYSLEHGRKKGSLVCHAGREGNEGKSFLLAPLECVYGVSGVFSDVTKGGFPLYGMEKCRMAVLDDWRFNEDLVSYRLQLLWFEGKPIVIARPQNHCTGHLKYTKDDPVFITTLEADLTSLKGKKILQGDIAMMLKRLRVFKFHRKIENADVSIRPCGHCFARLLLARGAGVTVERPPRSPAPATRKRGPEAPLTTCAQTVANWDVDAVVMWLTRMHLGHVSQAFRDNGVDGQYLLELSVADMVSELGLLPLQARKIRSRLYLPGDV